MNQREMFEIWKREKERIEAIPDFSETVMARIQERHALRRAQGSLLRHIGARPWVRAAVIVLGVLLGLARVMLTLELILCA